MQVFCKVTTDITIYALQYIVIKIGSELIWLWVAIDNKTKRILRLSISKQRKMFIAERFIADLVKNHGKPPIATEMVEHRVSSSVQILKIKLSVTFLL